MLHAGKTVGLQRFVPVGHYYDMAMTVYALVVAVYLDSGFAAAQQLMEKMDMFKPMEAEDRNEITEETWERESVLEPLDDDIPDKALNSPDLNTVETAAPVEKLGFEETWDSPSPTKPFS
jgi:hypothetical protein